MGRLRAAIPGSILAWLAGGAPAAAAPPVAGPSYCSGEYAEDLSALSARARGIEAAAGSYSYAVRTVATYECVSYGSDGNLKKTRSTARAYGTAFGYRVEGGDTLLLTNQHVAEWPPVTDEEHALDGVPSGCKRVSDSLKIVDDDHDGYAADDIPLTRVVVDPALDVAILRAHAKLQVIPWKVGKSAALVARNIVEVKGYPLGEFQATNVGKVISPYDHDVQGERNHDDFVIDALLTSGGSGSPVFAVSCRTGEFELVGIFHAHYSGASALNVVVAIDQVREMMTSLKRTTRVAVPEPDGAARARLADAARRGPDLPFFPFGPHVASLRVRPDGSFVFAIFPSDFPRTSSPLLAIVDLPSDDPRTFGKVGGVYLGGPLGLQQLPPTEADAETQGLLVHALGAMREGALATFDWRDASRKTAESRVAFERTTAKKRALARLLQVQRDAAQALVELVSRAAARTSGPVLGLTELESAPGIAAAAPSGGAEHDPVQAATRSP
jgi:S1-C subfamily serine protease